jgi:hypothetical protein
MATGTGKSASRKCAWVLALVWGVACTFAQAGGIAGTVTDSNSGTALANATLTAFDFQSGSTVTAQSQADGSFHVADLAAGTYALQVAASVHTGELYDNVPCTQESCDGSLATPLTLVDSSTELTDIDFALDASEFLSIELRNADTGQRMAGVWRVLLPTGTQFLNASADAPTQIGVPGGGEVRVAGSSSQCGPDSNAQCIAERYPDDLCVNLDCDLAAGTPITIPAGGSVSGLVLTLVSGSSVSGHVFAGDAPSTPLEAVNMTLYRDDGSVAIAQNTVSDGSYAFSGLDDGPFFVVAQAQSGYLGQLFNSIDCALNACNPVSGTPLIPTPANPIEADFILPRGAVIAGQLREQGIDLPITGATLEVFDALGNSVAQTTSSGSGQFLSPALPTGNYWLRASAADHVTTVFPDLPCDAGNCNPLDGEPIAVMVPQTTSLPDWQLPRSAGSPLQPALLYLNRCVGNCTVHLGPDSAINNTSSIISGTINLQAFSYSNASWLALKQCVRRVYAPYFVAVTDIDPGNVPHRELMIAGTPGQAGFDNDTLGVSPWACGIPIQNAIAFTFSNIHPDDTAEMCWTATHEGGHLFGLDHEFHQPDSMSYLDIINQFKHFTDADMPCGEFSAVPCNCGATQQQNTDLRLANEQGRDRVFSDGMGEDPWALPPESPLAPRTPRSSLSCGTRTDRYTPLPAALWIGGPAQITAPGVAY